MDDSYHREMPMERVREEQAIVLDFLPHGNALDTRPQHRKTPLVQAIGKIHLILLELVPKREAVIQPLQEVYIGEGKRDQIHHIIGRIPLDKLTATARSTLELIVKDFVSKNEPRFVEFFNKSQPLTTRMHQLELLPGLGKKHMWEILERREEKKFDNFKDIKARVKLLPDPEKLVAKRIFKELAGEEKHRIFVDV